MAQIKSIERLNELIISQFKAGNSITNIADCYHIDFVHNGITQKRKYVFDLCKNVPSKEISMTGNGSFFVKSEFSTNEDDYGTTNIKYDSVDEVEPIEVDRRSFSERLKFSKMIMN
jgi:hypothetical protein